MADGSPYYRTVKTILATGADQRADAPAATPRVYGRTRVTRPATELFADVNEEAWQINGPPVSDRFKHVHRPRA